MCLFVQVKKKKKKRDSHFFERTNFKERMEDQYLTNQRKFLADLTKVSIKICTLRADPIYPGYGENDVNFLFSFCLLRNRILWFQCDWVLSS